VSDIRTKSRRKFSIMLQQPLDSEEYWMKRLVSPLVEDWPLIVTTLIMVMVVHSSDVPHLFISPELLSALFPLYIYFSLVFPGFGLHTGEPLVISISPLLLTLVPSLYPQFHLLVNEHFLYKHFCHLLSACVTVTNHN
jgi:hypothetical protein